MKNVDKIVQKEGLKALKTQEFCTRKLLGENERVLSVLSKVLSFRRLRPIWPKNLPDGEKKSTPNFSAALTFSNLVCLQKRGSRQKFGLILHKTDDMCRNLDKK